MTTKKGQAKNDLPKVIYVKLGTHRPRNGDKPSRTPFGTWNKGLIRIDPRQEPQEMLDTLVHETLHEAQPEITEDGIERISNLISSVLWREGYRKTDI